MKSFIKNWYIYVFYLAVIIAAPLVNVRCGAISGEMMDFASEGKYSDFASMLALFMLFFAFHGLLLFLIQSIRNLIISLWRRNIKNEMFSKIMNSKGDMVSENDTGTYIAGFSNDITILENRYFEAVLSVTEAFLSVSVALMAIVNLNKKMAFIILTGETLSILICLVVRRYSMKKNVVYIENLSVFTQKVKEFFSGFSVIKNYSVEKHFFKRFVFFNDSVENSKEEADSSIAYVDVIARTSNSLIKFLLVGFGAVLVMNGEITIGIIFTAYSFTDQLVSPMHTLISQINSIGSVKSIVKRIKEIIKPVKVTDCSEDTGNSKALISFEGVSVEKNGVKILDNVSLDFEKGKKYLIIGCNGAGKTTLLKLLKKQSNDYSGTISVNGRNIRSLPRDILIRSIGYINDTVSLVCDTVRNNITLYRDVSEDEFQSAVKEAGIRIDTERIIRDGEKNISSGEMRRIELARIIIEKPDVIICDEAVSTLDIRTADRIENSLISMSERTIIFVSHNFSNRLVSRYDEIILMEKGRINARGTHESLINNNSYYRRLMEIKNGI
ncbi:MAG: ABC transporter ATP-binding protein [Ruminococcus sp.]|nr:ABC transporter ATP-binding protein [Ruminococcus sp.]